MTDEYRAASRAIDHSLVMTLGPLAAPGRGRRLLPFAIFLGGAASTAVIDTDANRLYLAAVLAMGAAAMLAALLVPWDRMHRRWQQVLLYFVIATSGLTLPADGWLTSHFVLVMIGPLIWLALYEELQPLLVGTGIVAGWLVVAVMWEPTAETGIYAATYIGLTALLVPIRALAAEQRETLGALLATAEHDTLTGLSNRRGLERQIREVAASDPVGIGLVYIDIDRFKSINDSLGHAAGDQLLLQVSRRLVSNVHEPDHVARVGGDEFVVLCVGDHQETTRLAGRIAGQLNGERFQLGDGSVAVTCSVGLTHAVETFDEAWMLSEAEHSMYRTKLRLASRRLRGLATS